MNVISSIAQRFMGLFSAGGETFTGWVTGIIPQVVCLLTFMNSIIKLVGEEKVEKFAKKLTSNAILRYSLFPLIADMFLGNPMAYSFGRFLDENINQHSMIHLFRLCTLLPDCSHMPMLVNYSYSWELPKVSRK